MCVRIFYTENYSFIALVTRRENEKILDFGAGFAMNEYFLKERGINIDSLDIDTEEVRSTFKKVHEKLNLNTYLYDGKTIPFKDNTYDKINFKASLTKMRKSDFYQIDLDADRNIGVRRFRVNDQGDREQIDYILTRERLDDLIDELS